MDFYNGKLNELSGGRVLDVATGGAYAIRRMMESFKDYQKFIGIDIIESERLEKVQEGFDKEKVELVLMDAENLEYEDNSFDTVAISNSLHHLMNLNKVLSEMKRVLKPGGLFLINEMKKDEQTNAQLTHVNMHHWWGKIDTERGITHYETYTKQEILDIVNSIGLSSIEITEFIDNESNPMDPETIEDLNKAVDEYLKRAEGLPSFDAFRKEGEELRKALHQNGYISATQVIVLGRK